MDLIARIAPFFAIIALGAVAGRTGLLGPRLGGWLSAYTFWVGFPALLIRWLGDAPPPDASQALALGLYGSTMTLILLGAWATARRLGLPKETAAGLPMVASLGNTAFLGAPLAVAVLGEAVRPQAAALVAIDFILLMGLAVAILQTGTAAVGLAAALRRVLANPTVLGAGCGLALAATGTRLPGPVDQSLTLLALTASPVALIALGGLIGREGGWPRRRDRGPLALALTIKLALAPLLVWLVLGAAGVAPDLRATATLLAACPTAVNVFIQTRNMGIFARGAAEAVIAGTVLSAVTLSLIAHFLA
ncbi:AEC family transporter [Phenylobacterium sp.]|uniref:AEC family transporter n=1 Tax=Phenylobacterium sp. TaxID=1871053 RepID=UPI0027313F97|nr:AEC family transporter [Phenylobacterium sp.]MDP1875268.1 AEC family transporter [Phenylobacterium sp.]